MNIKEGRIVEVHRHFSIAEMSQEDPEVKAWLGMSFRAIGPYFKNRATATGLTFEEQRLLLPIILNIEPTDRDFRTAVNRFYDSILTFIPKDGIKLQVGLTDDSKPLSDSNMPLKIEDYVRYRHLREHPDVAKDKNDALRLPNKRFYLVDPESLTKQAVTINSLEDKAMTIYMKHKEDKIKVDQILTMLGIRVRDLKHEDKVLRLKALAVKAAGATEAEQKQNLERFIAMAEDKDLEFKYLIEEMIGVQYLQRVGTNIILKESGMKIGDTLEDAVLYFRNPKNSRELNLMKAQYLTKVKGASEKHLPKEAEPVVQS
jgi:hypothetical protein